MKKIIFALLLAIPFIGKSQIRKIYIHPQTAVYLTKHLRECDSIKRQYLLTQREFAIFKIKMKAKDSVVQNYMTYQDSMWRNEFMKQDRIISALYAQNAELNKKKKRNKIVYSSITAAIALLYIFK